MQDLSLTGTALAQFQCLSYSRRMNSLYQHLSPIGATSRSQYWMITFGCVVFSYAIVYAHKWISDWPIIALFLTIGLYSTVQTIRRFHDAGWSRWWAALVFFPFNITIYGPKDFDLQFLEVHSVDIASFIRATPLIWGLALPSTATISAEADA